MYNVLIVDEEEHLLSALEQNLFPDRDDIAIVTAADGEVGLEKLKQGPVDLLISDIKMPGRIDGFQLILRAKEVAPDARVIIMTAFGSHRVQNFADRIGITHYIEKPFNTSELRDAILEILDEREGFQGVLSDLELTDIIQMLCLARRTALLHLKHRDHRGRIIFQSGDVVHAEFDDLLGEDAVYRMLALRQGDIFMQSDFEPHQRTIETSWQDLLFEGVKRADEERAALGPDDEEDDDSGPSTDVGMGLSSDDIDKMLVAGPSIDDEGEPEQSFFSEAELREIELVGSEVIEEELPLATLQEHSDDVLVEGRFGMPTGRSDDEDDFRTPFQREASALMADAAIAEAATRANRTPTPSTLPVATTHVSEPPPAKKTTRTPTGPIGFKGLLDAFARECPGLRQTAILSPAEGLALASVSVNGGYDSDALAAYFADVVTSAQRTVDAFGDGDAFHELQVALGDKYVLARCLDGTGYLHLAVVDRKVSLGVAIVLMRRFEKTFLGELEKG